jgi:hypothetical protein
MGLPKSDAANDGNAVNNGPEQRRGADLAGWVTVGANDPNHAGMRSSVRLQRRPQWHRGCPGVRVGRLRAVGWLVVAGGLRLSLAVALTSSCRCRLAVRRRFWFEVVTTPLNVGGCTLG